MQIIHIPRQFTKQPPVVDMRTILRAYCDDFAQRRYGVPSCMLSVEQRESLFWHFQMLWDDQDAISKGQAS